MGGCATKPRALKEEKEAPEPLDQVEAEDPSSSVANLKAEEDKQEEEDDDENKRTSLGNLLKESEESNENIVAGSEGEEIAVKEAIITTSLVETKGEEEQTKTQVYPTETSQIEVVETSTSLPSSVPTPEAPEAEEKAVDSVESVVKGVEQKEEVVEEKKEDAELKPSSTTEEEDGSLPSSTETTD